MGERSSLFFHQRRTSVQTIYLIQVRSYKFGVTSEETLTDVFPTRELALASIHESCSRLMKMKGYDLTYQHESGCQEKYIIVQGILHSSITHL